MKLKTMKLENFRGVKSLEIAFNESGITKVYGDNGTGKTTINDAFCWLLLGTPSTAEKNWTPKTEGSHDLNHIAEMTVENDSDGLEYTLKKDYHEVYTTKRGSFESTFSGHKTDHYINGVPVAEKDYKAKVEEMIGKNDMAKVLSIVGYFCESLNVKERRSILTKYLGDVTDADVIAKEPKLAPLADDLVGRDINGLYAMVKAQVSDIDKKIKEIPLRIDEASRMIIPVDMSEKDVQDKIYDLEHKIDIQNYEYSEKLEKIEADYQKSVFLANSKYNALADEYTSKYISKNQDTLKKRDVLSEEITELKYKLDVVTRKVDDAFRKVKDRKKVAESIYQEIEQRKAEKYVAETICKTCGQPLPADKLAIAKATWEDLKARSLKQKEEAVKDVEKEARHYDKLLGEYNDEFEKLDAELADKIEKRESIVIEDNIPFSKTDAGITAYTGKEAELAKAFEKRRASKEAEYVNNQAVIEELESKLKELRFIAQAHEKNADIKKRIDDLNNERQQLLANAEKGEQTKYLCELFIRTKVSMLDDAINGKFKTIKFKLFDEQINGGIKGSCEPMIPCNGIDVPYSSANTGSKINAGIELIEVLSDVYGVHLPIFIDNAESITNIICEAEQVIELIVSADDKTIRVE